MANIDVSELMIDPDFVDPVVLVHRTPTVSNLGENSLQEITVATVGSVQPASGQTIQRLPDAMRVGDVNSFWVRGEIVSDGNCQYPDLIQYKGVAYAVQTVNNWTNWGGGWSVGTCIRQRISL